MTKRKFTHPRDAEEGHNWQSDEGEKARIYTYDAGGAYPIHGAIWNERQEEWLVRTWDPLGAWRKGEQTPCDLVDAPRMVKVEGYVNVYADGTFSAPIYTRDLADKLQSSDRMSCIKIDIDVPEGKFDD